MNNPLAQIRCLVQTPSDAVRWACVLEATAPKPGNVYPGQSFDDLSYRDFCQAAEIASDWFGRTDQPMSQRVLGAAQVNHQKIGTNVNLGILLLLGPLVAADEAIDHAAPEAWLPAIKKVLAELDASDAENLFTAIQISAPGGLGEVEKWDVDACDPPTDIIEAMRIAEFRDRIARQYASGFTDLIDNVLPVLRRALTETGDLLGGIVRAHVALLQLEPDTLISRKNGIPKALEVQAFAKDANLDFPFSLARFNQYLRGDGHAMNPGTTADLIAAALYVLLRTQYDLIPNE